MGKYRVETENGSVYEIETEDTPQEPSMLESAVEGTGNFLRGVGASLWSVPAGAAKLAGMESQTLNQLATPPATMTGTAGNFLGQGAQFLVPSTGAARAAGLLANPVARGVARAGLEALGAGSLAGVQSGGDLEAARNAAITGGAIGGVTAAAPLAAPWLSEQAVRQYSRVLNPTKEKTKAITQQIVPELIRRGEWAATIPRLLNRAQDRMRYFGQQIDDIWQQMEQQGVTAQIDPILQRLDDVAREHFFVQNAQGQLTQLRGPAEAGLRELQGMAQTMVDAATVNPVSGLREIPVRTLRELRQYWDEVADKSGAFTKQPRELADWARGRAARYGGDAVRAELAQAHPDLSRINQEFSFWNRVADVTEQTVARRTGQQKPLTRQLMRAAGIGAGTTAGASMGGAMGGGIGAVLGGAGMEAFQTLISSPGWGTVSAVTKDRLANAITQGHQGQIIFYLNQALKAAGMAAITGQPERGAKSLAPSSAR